MTHEEDDAAEREHAFMSGAGTVEEYRRRLTRERLPCTCIHEQVDVPVLGVCKVLVLADPACGAHGRVSGSPTNKEPT